MKYRYPAILAVLVVLIAMAVAGCTSTSPSAPAASTTSGGATTTPATTSTSSNGALSTLASAFDKSNLHWYEYQMTTSTGTSKMRFDYGVDYNGVKADKVSINSETKEGDVTTDSVMEVYSADGKTLGGKIKTMQDGKVLYESDIPASTGATGSTGSSGAGDPFVTNAGAGLTSAGTETVSVPGYTGLATKYTMSDASGSTGSVWVATGVPVPVKYEGNYGGETTTLELTGWG